MVADVDEQKALLLSYRTARDICHVRWQLRVLRAEKDALFADIDTAEEEFEDDTDNIANSTSTAPRRQQNKHRSVCGRGSPFCKQHIPDQTDPSKQKWKRTLSLSLLSQLIDNKLIKYPTTLITRSKPNQYSV